jgi:predicted AlkP superfamily phosphohydrolase/phosphomutase
MKTLVIGLDAATWRIMNPLIKQGKLHNIATLMKDGASGKLRSTIPPMTPLAWTSIITGVNPGKHGIYDFVTQDPKTYRVVPINYSYLTQPTIWDIFKAYGRKVGVVNFPLAFPPPKVDSFFISGLGSPEHEIYSYPPELDEYQKSCGYRIHPRFSPNKGTKRYFNEVKDLTEIQCDITIKLMKQWDWELLWVVFQGLDWIQHYLWNTTIDGENAVEAFYCYMDSIVGQLLKHVENDWNIVILSDHGFRMIKSEIHLNNILEKWGYLMRAEIPKELTKGIRASIFKAVWKLGQKLPVNLKQRLKQRIPKVIYSNLRELQNEQLRLHEVIKWNRTRAFSFGYMGRIYIHRKGKYSQGIVTSREYEELREEIIAQLKSLKDPETGKPMIGEIFRKEEIYSGDHLESAPDIVFNPFDFAYMVYGDFSDVWFHHSQVRIADHDMEGIIIMKGKNIRQGAIINCDVVDVTPTLLYLHGLPLLKDMDGRVLQNILTKELIEKQKVRIVKVIPQYNIKHKPSEEEHHEIQKRLRDLGYL